MSALDVEPQREPFLCCLPAPDTLAWRKQHLVVQGGSPTEQSLLSISAEGASKGI